MAKLSAHGYELARIKRYMPDEDTAHFTQYRRDYSFRSDGHILTCDSALENNFYGSSRRHSWGWKLWKRIKPELRRDPEVLAETVADWIERWKTRLGDKVMIEVQGGAVRGILDMRKIQREDAAVEAEDHKAEDWSR